MLVNAGCVYGHCVFGVLAVLWGRQHPGQLEWRPLRNTQGEYLASPRKAILAWAELEMDELGMLLTVNDDTSKTFGDVADYLESYSYDVFKVRTQAPVTLPTLTQMHDPLNLEETA